ncbi:hypothetical protein GCM10018791_05750 [Streptomyces zaomyceticus]|nr:hypothetical protein GCM10018791_05750 [Streptomyces zaomyceticus]
MFRAKTAPSAAAVRVQSYASTAAGRHFRGEITPRKSINRQYYCPVPPVAPPEPVLSPIEEIQSVTDEMPSPMACQ